MARQLIEAGVADCILVVGFERMFPGSLPLIYKDRAIPVGRTIDLSAEMDGKWDRNLAWTPQLFAKALAEHQRRTGSKPEDFAKIAETNRNHAAKFPYAQLQKGVTSKEVLESPVISGNLNRLQCSPATTGGAAAVVVSEDFLRQRPYLQNQSILIAGQSMATDSEKLYAGDPLELLGTEMTRRAAKEAFEMANINPKQIDVMELHDCFTPNQMVMMGAMGLVPEGKEYELIRRGDNTYGGRHLINPSGGLIGRGHPLGATGIAQCAELCWQLRGWATTRQNNKPAKIAVAHNMGLGGATIVTVLKPRPGAIPGIKAQDGVERLGYNPAIECRDITFDMLKQVRSEHYSDYALKETEKPIQASL
jgi:sterol carrier protein 2